MSLAKDPEPPKEVIEQLRHAPLSVRADVILKMKKVARSPSFTRYTVARTPDVDAELILSRKILVPRIIPSSASYPFVSLIRKTVADVNVVLLNFSFPTPGSVLAVSVRYVNGRLSVMVSKMGMTSLSCCTRKLKGPVTMSLILIIEQTFHKPTNSVYQTDIATFVAAWRKPLQAANRYCRTVACHQCKQTRAFVSKSESCETQNV